MVARPGGVRGAVMATKLNSGPGLRLPSREWKTDRPRISGRLRILLVFAIAAVVLYAVQYVAFLSTRIHVELAIHSRDVSFRIDGHELDIQAPSPATRVVFVPGSPVMREYQIDGTDDTNNFTEDASYVSRMADEPYFQFQNWMRDADSYSRWQDIALRDTPLGTVQESSASTNTLPATVTLPGGQSVVVSASLMRLEVPARVLVFCGTDLCTVFSINRNDRYVRADSVVAEGAGETLGQVFFPSGPAPFAAEIAYLLAHVALWSLALLTLLTLVHALANSAFVYVSRRTAAFIGDASRTSAGRHTIFGRIHPHTWDRLAIATIALAFGFTCYVALVQYQAQPHILDASAYVMQAKIFASGHLSAPTPSNLAAFQGPFMVTYDGRWFAQYPPGASLLLAAGYLLRAPWLIEPIMGALGLWGIYRLGRMWYGHATAWIAVFLGALSPFYIYLAASYLSHVPAMFFEVYFLLFLTRYARRMYMRDLVLAAVSWSGLLLTRELSAALVGLVAPVLIFCFYWRRLRRERGRLLVGVLAALGVALCGGCVYLIYNYVQTGAALVTPRALFSPADQLGFGIGVGFYGQHTLAAGFVNLDELLTSLSIDLYGWPFYLTLAFLPLAFVGKRVRKRWDVCCLALACVLAAAQVAYFYHGIYLGPRYLFDTLPFLLLLTARGMTNLAGLVVHAGRSFMPAAAAALRQNSAQVVVAACVGVLLLCNLTYYLPRQLVLHTNFSGLPVTKPVDVGAIYRLHPSHAVILTDDWYIYNYVVWPLNDPTLSGSALYAYAGSPDAVNALLKEYPHRRFYNLVVGQNGDVHLEPLTVHS